MLSLPGYQIGETLHTTANSIVYRGQRTADHQPVILKALNKVYPTPVERARFQREYEVTRQLQGPGVIEALDLLPHQYSLVVVLEDFGALSLKQLMGAHSWSLGEVLELALEITTALAAIHQQGVMHKDLNPSNIVLNPATGQLKLIDFGLATVLSREKPEMHSHNHLEGTLAYISPEQTGRMNRAVDYRTDFYSLGVTLYELLTGQLPFPSTDPLELVHAHIALQPRAPTALNPTLPRVLADIILKLLAKTAEERYQSAHGLIADLAEVRRQWMAKESVERFPLGRYDISPRFQLPQVLYGRESELTELLGAFERVSAGSTELLLVAGQAGVGKTALINELHKPIIERRGYFVAGKFDQFQRNIPYTGLLQALRELIHQLLTEDDAELNRWREKLLATLGPNGQIITEVLPELELLIGPQPAVPRLGPLESQNRFQLLFRNFVDLFARPEHPLVLFLDDLQWADSASLRLLQLFLTDPMHQHLLVVGAYREAEMDAAHPLPQLLRTLSEAEVRVTRLSLSALGLGEVTRLIADTVQTDAGVARPLAEIVFAKTQGNPFFVGEFLKALYQEGLLFFIPPRVGDEVGEWHWEVAEIQARDITDNVVEFMRGELEQLPARTQETLKVAAALGNLFNLVTLARVQERSPAETAAALWPSLQAGLVLPLGEAYRLFQLETLETVEALGETMDISYRFLHDRVQQAAYALIDEAERPTLHLRVGRLLLASSEAEQEERLFEIVDHLNAGISLITAPEEREALARLNLRTGQKAKAAAAYDPAFQHLQHGLVLLSESCWQTQYELTLALYQAAAESAYLKGDFAQMDSLAGTALAQARTVLDKVKLYEILIQASAAQNKILESVQLGQAALALLGVSLPANPSKAHALVGLLRTRLALGRRSIDSLASLPKMQDAHQLATMRLLRFAASSAYYAAPNLYPLLIFQMVQRSIQYGNAPASPSAYGTYGLVLCTLGEIDRGYEFGQLALKLIEQPESREFRAHLSAISNTGIRHLKEPLRDTLPALQAGYQSGMETGDLPYASVNAAVYGYHLFLVGAPLAFAQEEISRYLISVKRMFKHDVYFHGMMALQQMIANLMEPAPAPGTLSGAYAEEEELLGRLRQSNDLTTLCLSYQYKGLLSYHFGEYVQALGCLEQAEGLRESIRGMSFLPGVLYFYQSLALLALYPDASPQVQKGSLKKVAANQKKMKTWAAHAPMNYQHKYELVQAEWERVRGTPLAAMQHYQRALSLARTHEYPQDEALANELAARFYLAQELPLVAQGHLMNARYGYLTWGAGGKVDWLDARYPHLLAQPGSQGTITSSSQYTLASASTTAGDGGHLDLATVIKASQTISSEIDLDRLLDKLLCTVMENAGAQKGALLLVREGKLFIEAEGSVDAPEVRVLQAIPVEESSSLSAAIVHYVARTQEEVVLDDAGREGRFASDPYVRDHHPRSIMSTPLLNQGKLIGVLYLENNLTTGAFTPDRVEMVELLGTQAAISITNVQAIATRAEQERTRLEKQLLEQRAQDLAELNASKDKFFSIISHDLRSPFNALLGLAQLMNRYSDGLSQAEVKDFSGRIYASGKQVLALLDNLLNWSQMQTGRMVFQPQPLNLQALVHGTLSVLEGTAASKEITLTSEVGEYTVYADANMLETVLRNLVSNALKFTDSGGRVQVTATRSRGRVEVAVTDTGRGMSRETMQQLFRIDVTHTTAGTAQEKGTGLGLILSKELVEKNGGQIWVESVLGKGSTFKFTVPLAV